MNCLKDEFFVLRSNAIQRRRFTSDLPRLNPDYVEYDQVDDNVMLLRGNSRDVERSLPTSTPSYVGQAEALQYQMSRLESKVEQLDALHKSHLSRPTLDDDSQQETEIRALTRDITEVSFFYT